jgi:hypothetical protein
MAGHLILINGGFVNCVAVNRPHFSHPHPTSRNRFPLEPFFLGEPGRTASLLLDSLDGAQTVIDPRDAAESAGLRYVSDTRPGIRRKKAGKGFMYTRAEGSRLFDPDVLKRIKALAIPPAWTDV